MSQHNIVGSEAFDRRPTVYLRSVKSGGVRRLRARTAMAFGLGVFTGLGNAIFAGAFEPLRYAAAAAVPALVVLAYALA